MTAHPITRLRADSIAAFASVDVTFASGINILVGENGAGKSQLIKLLYSVASVLNERDPLSPGAPRRTGLNTAIASKLVGVFRPESLGRLTNRRRGRTRSEVSVNFEGITAPMSFSFASTARTEVKAIEVPERWIEDTPVFLPTRELLSIYPGFVALYDERSLEFDETWRDTANLLGRPARRGPRESRAAAIIAPIEEALGGAVVEESNRFYLQQTGVGKLEMHLVAEGFRKLGMLVRLVASGTLLNSGYLFWDEPETNLNPRTIRQAARTMIELSKAGVQIFIATHSLFLLRELEILVAESSALGATPDVRFIGLHRTEEGVVVQSGETISDIGDITALDEELNQTDRYLQEVD
jgi:energy-coupling factor transporter ATP-binding protein EcfA2